MGMVWIMTTASDQDVASLRADPSSVYDFTNSEEAFTAQRTLDLDKQWHAVHFMLTGSAGVTDDPMSLILGSFEEIGPDHGYGPAWLIPNAFLVKFSAALSATNDDELKARYDPTLMVREQVYIAEALQEEGEEGLGFLMEDIARIREFTAKAAADGVNAIGLIT